MNEQIENNWSDSHESSIENPFEDSFFDDTNEVDVNESSSSEHENTDIDFEDPLYFEDPFFDFEDSLCDEPPKDSPQ